jgi:transposase
MLLVKEMPVNAVAELVGEHDTRLWRILKHYVKQARAKADYSSVRKIGIDETSAKMGHDYISLFVDLERARLLFATEGKGKETVSAFTEYLSRRGGSPEKIECVCCDLSPSFVAGIKEHLPNSEEPIFLSGHRPGVVCLHFYTTAFKIDELPEICNDREELSAMQSNEDGSFF